MRIEGATARRLGVIAFSAVMALVSLPSGASAGGSNKLPDLRMASLQRFHLQTTSSGRRLIRFDTTIVNVGVGPFEVLGQRACTSITSCPGMSVRQVVYRTDGSKATFAREGAMRYAGDGHNHWHVQRIERYDIFRRSAGAEIRRGAKVGFCFFDNVAYRTSLPGAPSGRVYAESGCGTSSSTTTRVGLSVGWGDLYPWDFAYQWIDITGLAAGNYRVCVTTDPQDRYLETNDANNHVWQDVTLYSGGGLGIGAKGWTSCRTGIPSTSSTAADDGYPDQTALSGYQPGSVSCAIPNERDAARDGGRAAVSCRQGADKGRAPMPTRAGPAGESGTARHALPAMLAPNRRSTPATVAAFVCRI
jgi:hypothetical protein